MRPILLGAAVIVLVATSFQAGRQVVIVRRERDEAARPSRMSLASTPAAKIRANGEEDQKIRLENLASISFGELYDLIHAASPEQRSKWAHELEALPPGPRKLAAIEAFCKTLVQLDANAAVDFVLGIDDRQARRVAVEAVLGTFREADIKLIAEMLLKLQTTGDRKMKLSSVTREWLQIDPPAAIDFMEQHRDQLPDDELDSFMWTWALFDPAAARNWFERQDVAEQTGSIIHGIVFGWYNRDPAAAIEYAAAHTDSKDFRDAIAEIANSIIRNTPDEPVDFIKEMPAGQAREALIDAVIASTKIRQRYNSEDDVVRWLVELPNSIWTGRVDGLLSEWEKKEGDSLLDWLNELPAEKRAQVLTEHSPRGKGIPPERAFELAMQISDRELRDAALRKFAERLGGTPQEALKSLRNLPLQEAQKRYVRSFLKLQ